MSVIKPLSYINKEMKNLKKKLITDVSDKTIILHYQWKHLNLYIQKY